jgi:hypothetical protein
MHQRSLAPRPASSVAGALAVAAFLCAQPPVAAQHLVEVRGGPVLDVFYVGVPGSNEFNLGGGYTIRRGRLSLTPLVYAVAGREASQRGVKVALLAAFDRDGWKVLAFLGHYIPVSGDVGSYQVLDTLDVTRAVGRWEAGVQSGFFHAGGDWNAQVGPVLKRNDRLGAWAASYRFGHQPEFRVGRVLTF